MKNTKKAYMAPMVEVMNARVEKGFELSGMNTDLEPVTPADINIVDGEFFD